MVTSARSAAGMAAIWIFAVAGVSATAWVAIDRAGHDLAAPRVSSLPLVSIHTPTRSEPAATAATPAPAPAPARAPTARRVTPPKRATISPHVTPSTRTRQPRHTPAPAPVPAPTPQDQTLSLDGGLVSARCTADQVRLLNAQPENDWRVQVDTSSPWRVVVIFQSGEEGSVSTTQVTAMCAKGAPRFTVTNR